MKSLCLLLVLFAILPLILTVPSEYQMRCFSGMTNRRYRDHLFSDHCRYSIILSPKGDDFDVIWYSASGVSAYRKSPRRRHLEEIHMHFCRRLEFMRHAEINCACLTWFCNGVNSLEELYSVGMNITWVETLPESFP